MINKKKIALFGPHDRNNYGDLLFPIMLEHAINNNNKYEFIKYSIVKSDLTSVGAYKSNNYKQLTKDINNGEIQIVIITGGESLSASWGRLYSYINAFYSYLYENTKYATSQFIYPIVYKILGAKTEFPFFINKKDFQKEIKVIYNSVGGITNNLNLKERIEQADYLAVRTKIDNLNFDNIFTYPDSAIIMSDIFQKENFIEFKYLSNYLFFQISNYKIQNSLHDAINEIIKILDSTNYNLVLCPIGLAKGHEDQLPLKAIYSKLNKKYKERVFFIKTPKIHDIMGLIANSEFYIGTSLHGVITAMSYGVKYLALNPNQSKIVNYIKTWTDFDVQRVMSNTFDFYDKFKVLDDDENILPRILESTFYQKIKYYNSVDNIIKVIEDK